MGGLSHWCHRLAGAASQPHQVCWDCGPVPVVLPKLWAATGTCTRPGSPPPPLLDHPVLLCPLQFWEVPWHQGDHSARVWPARRFAPVPAEPASAVRSARRPRQALAFHFKISRVALAGVNPGVGCPGVSSGLGCSCRGHAAAARGCCLPRHWQERGRVSSGCIRALHAGCTWHEGPSAGTLPGLSVVSLGRTDPSPGALTLLPGPTGWTGAGAGGTREQLQVRPRAGEGGSQIPAAAPKGDAGTCEVTVGVPQGMPGPA